jgi:hypothetical protein
LPPTHTPTGTLTATATTSPPALTIYLPVAVRP